MSSLFLVLALDGNFMSMNNWRNLEKGTQFLIGAAFKSGLNWAHIEDMFDKSQTSIYLMHQFQPCAWGCWYEQPRLATPLTQPTDGSADPLYEGPFNVCHMQGHGTLYYNKILVHRPLRTMTSLLSHKNKPAIKQGLPAARTAAAWPRFHDELSCKTLAAHTPWRQIGFNYFLYISQLAHGPICYSNLLRERTPIQYSIQLLF